MKIVVLPVFLRDVKRLPRPLHILVKNRIDMLSRDPFEASLRTHKLHGDLHRYWSCSLDYKYRIIFLIDNDIITLHRIGTHDDVY